jgi:plastocyanin domain-containing protein
MKNKIIILALCGVILLLTSSNADAQRKNQKQKVQNITVSLTSAGYQPASFRLKKDIPARITFIRKTEDECGKEVVFPAYQIRRELPLNTPVTIRFTPRKAGTFSFVCGMNMLRGKIIVR